MPETAVETEICHICGAEVREGSQFCYNCGGSLEQVAVSDAEVPVLVEDVTENGDAAETVVPDATAVKRSRRRPRPSKRSETVEVVWEPRAGLSTGFIVGTMAFIVLAILLFIAAAILK